MTSSLPGNSSCLSDSIIKACEGVGVFVGIVVGVLVGVREGVMVGEGVKVGDVRGKTVGAIVFVGGIVVGVAVGGISLLEDTNLLASSSAAACRVGTGSKVGITNCTSAQPLTNRMVMSTRAARANCFLLGL